MNKKILDFIKKLTKNDEKSLSQKALKASEEVGELARAVLPFENASGTKHRFIDKSNILEEAIDGILVNLSIAYDLGFTDEDIESMMHEKASKWQHLQSREAKIDDSIPYEIHITIKAPESIENFKFWCNSFGVKPIVLDLGDKLIDVMTSSHYYGNNVGALNEAKRISYSFKNQGFEVLREKIETVPWHPAAPSDSDKNPKMPNDCYFEAHIGCLITDEIDERKVNRIAKDYNSHLSRNAFKKNADGTYIKMITMRTYDGTNEQFQAIVDRLKSSLDDVSIQYEKVITEFSIYDTKISHDFLWLNQKEDVS